MEKVKVTQEQADWLGKYELSQEQIDHYINIQPFKKRPDSPIVDWSASKLARALYIGYEVEPNITVGDYISNKDGSRLVGNPDIKSVRVEEIKGSRVGYCGGYGALISNVRLSTPEEIAKEKKRSWWAKHGRKPWELKGHDVLTHNLVNGMYIVSNVCEGVISFYGINDNRTLEEVKENFKVKYFAEDRKDIEQQS